MNSSNKKRAAIATTRVYTENNKVYTYQGRNERYYMPLRWVPVHITKA